MYFRDSIDILGRITIPILFYHNLDILTFHISLYPNKIAIFALSKFLNVPQPLGLTSTFTFVRYAMHIVTRLILEPND